MRNDCGEKEENMKKWLLVLLTVSIITSGLAYVKTDVASQAILARSGDPIGTGGSGGGNGSS